MEQQYFSQVAAAAFLGVTVQSLCKWKKNGLLTPTQVGKNSFIYSKGQLEELKKDLYSKKRGPGRPIRGY